MTQSTRGSGKQMTVPNPSRSMGVKWFQLSVRILPACLLAGLIGLLATSPAAWAQVAVRAGTVHTMAGEPITDGVIVITDGKIAAVGPSAATRIPEGYEVIEAAVATPGLVDARGTAGLTGVFNSAHDSDQLEGSAAVQPALRAIDAYNPRERLIQWVREFGVTTLHTGHAPGKLVSGQTIIVKTRGNTVEEALVRSPAMVSATLGPSANEGSGRSPGTRGKQVAMLREELIKAGEFVAKRRRAEAPVAGGEESKPPSAPDRSLHLEMLGDVVEGRVPLLVHADRAQDIENALRLREEFNLRMVIESGAESYLLIDRIKASGVDVIVHPSMQRAVWSAENQSFETAGTLAKAGIRVAIESGYESYVPKTRVVLFEAAIAAANGLGFEGALAAVTIDAARILGVETRVGSLEVGKDGDVALYDGDPFEYTTRCVGVVIEGQVVSRAAR